MSSQTVEPGLLRLPIRSLRLAARNTTIGVGREAGRIGRRRRLQHAEAPRTVGVLLEREIIGRREGFAACRLDGRRQCRRIAAVTVRAATDDEHHDGAGGKRHIAFARRLVAEAGKIADPRRLFPSTKTWTSVVEDEPMPVNRAVIVYCPAAGAVQRTALYSPFGPGCKASCLPGATWPRAPKSAQDNVLKVTLGSGPKLLLLHERQSGERLVAQIESPAVEHHDAAVVQRAHQRQGGDGMLKDGSLAGFVQQAPHRNAGVIAVALDHRRRGVVESLGHLRRIFEAPTGEVLFVHHQADLVAHFELIARRHAGNETNGVKTHRLAIQEVFAQHVRIDGHARTR